MRTCAAALALLLIAGSAAAQDLARGVVVDDVKCLADPAQSYALYLPSGYAHDKTWSVILAFHPAARGRQMVEKYQAAAEQYGYVIAASNNSRNGPWAVSAAAAQAMWGDVVRRFAIDERRIYLAGMSGGARVAMEIALANKAIAGVIASSAGFPDSKPRASVPFAIFGTAGTEDFNHLEMQQLDRKLTSPHRLAIFEGGHTLPPDAVATEAIEWLELQAMKDGRRPKDDALIAKFFEKRRQAIVASTDPAGAVRLLESIVADFSGLHSVDAEAKRLEALSAQSDVKKTLSRERRALDDEASELAYIFNLEASLANDSNHDATLLLIRERLRRFSDRAKSEGDSPERRQARRILRTINAGVSLRVQDREYVQMVNGYGLPGR